MQYTSAGALYELLKKASASNFNNLSEALTKILGIAGEDAHFIATVQAMKLAASVMSDIQSDGFDHEARKALMQNFRMSEKLLRFETYSLSQSQLKNDVFSGVQLNNLYTISLALDGKINRVESHEQAKKLVEDVQSIRSEIVDSTMPDELKEGLRLRLLQIESALEHFQVWGASGLKQSITLLAGELLLNLDAETKEKNPSSVTRIVSTIQKATDLVNKTAKTMKNGTEIVDRSQTIVGAITDLSDKLS